MERYTQSALTYEADRADGLFRRRAGAGGHRHLPQADRTLPGELVLANDRIAAMTQALYRSGLSDYLDVIDAQRSLY
ncbi:MAG: transporter, partial [Alistipes finegoldii]